MKEAREEDRDKEELEEEDESRHMPSASRPPLCREGPRQSRRFPPGAEGRASPRGRAGGKELVMSG